MVESPARSVRQLTGVLQSCILIARCMISMPWLLAQTLADETRLRLLHLLLSGEATVSELGAHLGLPQPRISTHLAILREAGLVAVATSGRQRTYRVDADRAQSALAGLEAGTVAHGGKVTPARPRVEIDATPIRRARTCYDHLAGIAGVQLLDELLRRNWLAVTDANGNRPQYGVTPAGVHAFLARRRSRPGTNVAPALRLWLSRLVGAPPPSRRCPRRGGTGCPRRCRRRPASRGFAGGDHGATPLHLA